MAIEKISHKPPRWDQDNSIYFLTFCTFNRISYLHRKLIPEMIIENLKFYARCLKDLIAYTIMPDHIHLLVTVNKVKNLSDYLRDFKKRTSKETKKVLGIKEKHVWQRGTMDHCIRLTPGNEDYVNHLNYTYYNCVKHLGIVPREFPFHNFTEAIGKGWIEEDFGTKPPLLPSKFEFYE